MDTLKPSYTVLQQSKFFLYLRALTKGMSKLNVSYDMLCCGVKNINKLASYYTGCKQALLVWNVKITLKNYDPSYSAKFSENERKRATPRIYFRT